MKQLYIKQKMFTFGGEQFTVTDGAQRPVYTVEGSFLQIPKSFSIRDVNGFEVARVEKKTFSWLPHFSVFMGDAEVAAIDQEFSFFRPRYRIDAQGLAIEGDWWDMNFTVSRNGVQVAAITQRWLSWGDSYEVTIVEDALETLIVALVVAIDKVKADRDSSSASSAASSVA
ncbi:LURP-one-related family protein [Bifidobacterium pullorum]